MKKLALAALFIYGLTAGSNVFAQIQAPADGPKLAGPMAKGPGQQPPHPGQPAPGEQGLRVVSTVTGKVVKLQGNNDFVLDGFYMINGSDSLLVKIPAHMGSQISPMVKPGSQVSVSGVSENMPGTTKEMRMVSLTAGGKTLTDNPPAAPVTPAQETTVTGNGKVTSLQTDREGRVSGVFIDNKTILRFPPHVSAELGNTLAKGAAVAYSGSEKNKVQGEVSLEDYKVIHCSTITMNGQQYLVR
ncbi:hypothetical protein [Dyadobacter sp. CY347]|uniref:hypothetical protein n=1 Tax=Dyadobacter sp. CY347 TaxID=2909336 RepID=UPI001F1AE04E|nr:hypothetical protein [Dyadobacter sp. CY347]MCF2489172.1 hypothetical protein [Dyadobacter sp. CY347]